MTKCNQCGKEKELTEFYKSNKSKCKECVKANSKNIDKALKK